MIVSPHQADEPAHVGYTLSLRQGGMPSLETRVPTEGGGEVLRHFHLGDQLFGPELDTPLLDAPLRVVVLALSGLSADGAGEGGRGKSLARPLWRPLTLRRAQALPVSERDPRDVLR